MSVKDNLKREMALRDNMSQYRLAELSGVKQPTILRMLKGSDPKAETVKRIAKALGIPSSKLLDDDYLTLSDFEENEATAKYLTSQNLIEIPQYEDVSGSMGGGITATDKIEEITSWQVTKNWALSQLPTNTGLANLRIITGRGDSMRGMYEDGDPIIIDIGIKSLDYDGVYFFRIADELFIKRLQRMPDGTVLGISKNQDYRDMVITKDHDFGIVGRVLKVWKGEEL